MANQRWTMKHGAIKNLPAKSFSCHPERSKFLRSRKNVRSPKTPQYRSLPLTASGTNQKSGGQIFSCHPERCKFVARQESCGVEGRQDRWLPLTALGNSHRLLAASQAPDSETRRYATPSRSSSSQSASFSSSRR